MRRKYPERPIAAVGGIIIHSGKVLLVKRKVDPYAGHWSIPGGAIEIGETARSAVVREVEEESGLRVEPVRVVDIYDNIVESAGRIRYHYTIIDYMCRYISGSPTAGSDVEDARWVTLPGLDDYELTPLARSAIAEAVRRLEDEG